MSSASSIRARAFKQKTFKTQEEKRREHLQRQKNARRDLADHARMLAMGEYEASGSTREFDHVESEPLVEQVEMETTQRPKRMNYWAKRRLRDFYSSQVCTPEWMTEVPEDLNGSGSSQGQGWYVMCRPEGKRCLLISAKGRTISRLQHGEVLHKFSSTLPNGSPHSGFAQDYSILDAIYHEEDDTYYVLDMMCWKGYSLYDCTAEFRFYWVRTKLEEVQVDQPHQGNRFRILPAVYYECDPHGLEAAYTGPTPYIKDGLLFYHKQGHYALGLTPLVLLWKDASTTRYLMHSDRQAIMLLVRSIRAVQQEAEMVQEDVLEEVEATEDVDEAPTDPQNTSIPDEDRDEDDDSLSIDGGDSTAPRYHLCTMDGIVLGGLTKAERKAAGVKSGDILRLSIGSASYHYDEITGAPIPCITEMQFEKRCSINRALADSWTKILFQSMLRFEPITFDALYHTACNPHTSDLHDEFVGVSSIAGVDEERPKSLLHKPLSRVFGHQKHNPQYTPTEPEEVKDAQEPMATFPFSSHETGGGFPTFNFTGR